MAVIFCKGVQTKEVGNVQQTFGLAYTAHQMKFLAALQFNSNNEDQVPINWSKLIFPARPALIIS